MTKHQTQQRHEHSVWHHTTNKVIKVLLESGSDGDLMFYEKGTPMHFPYLNRQMPTSWHTLIGNFLMKGRNEVNIKFFENSNSKEYLVTPGVVEYDKKKMTKPVYDLIL